MLFYACHNLTHIALHTFSFNKVFKSCVNKDNKIMANRYKFLHLIYDLILCFVLMYQQKSRNPLLVEKISPYVSKNISLVLLIRLFSIKKEFIFFNKMLIQKE